MERHHLLGLGVALAAALALALIVRGTHSEIDGMAKASREDDGPTKALERAPELTDLDRSGSAPSTEPVSGNAAAESASGVATGSGGPATVASRAAALFESYRDRLATRSERWVKKGVASSRQEGEEYAQTEPGPETPNVDRNHPAGQLVLGAYEKHKDYGPARVSSEKREELASRIKAVTKDYNESPGASSALELAKLYNETRSFDRALYFSRKAIDQDSQCREARLLRTELFRRFGMGKKLQEEWRTLLAQEPGNAEWQRLQQDDLQHFGERNGLGDGPIEATVSLPGRKLPPW